MSLLNIRKIGIRRIFWISLGLLTLIAVKFGSNNPEWIEQYYSRGLFLGIRWMIDYLIAWMPFPLYYLFWIIISWLTVRGVRKWWKSSPTWLLKITNASLSLLAFFAGIVFLFYFLWGFNYSRVSIEETIGLKPKPLTLEQIHGELLTQTIVIKRLRERIPGITDSAITKTYLPESLEKHLRQNVEEVLEELGYPTIGRVRGRLLYPKGIFLHFSSSGLYWPFTGEGHIDAGLNPLQWPYVMAHELSHGYGFGDEGTCNFLGYLACVHSDDPMVAYAGNLAYWRTLATNYLRYKPEEYRTFRKELPKGIQNDLDAINVTLQSYPDWMPKLRYRAYNSYLKAQGIKEGIKNYNRVLMLVKAWNEMRES